MDRLAENILGESWFWLCHWHLNLQCVWMTSSLQAWVSCFYVWPSKLEAPNLTPRSHTANWHRYCRSRLCGDIYMVTWTKNYIWNVFSLNILIIVPSPANYRYLLPCFQTIIPHLFSITFSHNLVELKCILHYLCVVFMLVIHQHTLQI